ncbi:glycoside hydrolase family 31 [Kipferlia bialata]|uniref:Maltase n=1 Tax=Kipferlia bialata TaxID=797122 RepID=A0A9K3GJ52_9EUKA|nr:glycoside hydrolase family 31 [Kipferlia bialata]|eukprot:g6281.t1
MWIVCLCLLVALVHCEYRVTAVTEGAGRLHLSLSLSSPSPLQYAADIPNLSVDLELRQLVDAPQPDVYYLHFGITDADDADRYVVRDVVTGDYVTAPALSDAVLVEHTSVGEAFGLRVTRVFDSEIILDLYPSGDDTQGLVYQDLYLQVTSHLALPSDTNPVVYGLGERAESIVLPVGDTYTLWTRDAPGLPLHTNIYGVHPWVMEVREGLAYGLLDLTSNALDVDVMSDRLTFKQVGGVIDMTLIVGTTASASTPLSIIAAYQQLVGLSTAAPRWVLGWHQCRWMGGGTLGDIEDTVDKYRENDIPLDCQWLDIDYMDEYRVFTTSPDRFPTPDVKAWTQEMRENGQNVVAIVDPGVKIDDEYDTYLNLLDSCAYLTNEDGSPLVSKVWADCSIFPDFKHPNVTDWWQGEWESWFERTGFDPNAWLDMNEIAAFCDGICPDCPVLPVDPRCGDRSHETPYFDPNNPPYTPGGITLDMHGIDASGYDHYGMLYDTHSTYALNEAIVSHTVLPEAYSNVHPGEDEYMRRPFTLTRSQFSGSAQHTSHWLGDDESSFSSLLYSVPTMMNQMMNGFTTVGADIGGFLNDCWDELFLRWVPAGIWYTFSRDHSCNGTAPQEPWVFDGGVEITKDAVEFKYSVSPMMYHAIMHTTRHGGVVNAAPGWLWPTDTKSVQLNTQFVAGDAVMVAPVLFEGVDGVSVYLPLEPTTSDGVSGERLLWFDLMDEDRPVVADGSLWAGQGVYLYAPSPLGSLSPAYVRSGRGIMRPYIISDTLENSWVNPWDAELYLSPSGCAVAMGWADDGLSQDSPYSEFSVTMDGASLSFAVVDSMGGGYSQAVQQVRVYNMQDGEGVTDITYTDSIGHIHSIGDKGEAFGTEGGYFYVNMGDYLPTDMGTQERELTIHW